MKSSKNSLKQLYPINPDLISGICYSEYTYGIHIYIAAMGKLMIKEVTPNVITLDIHIYRRHGKINDKRGNY
jgi:hypothetical protein